MQDELISAAMQGDEPACRDLFDRWYPKAYRVGKAVCGSRSLAEDAVQEALIRFWRALPRLQKPEDTEGYFLRIVTNEARRIRSRRKAEESRSELQSETNSDEEEREQRLELAKAIDKLPEAMRSAVRLHYYGGFTEAETSEMLGVSLPSLKMRLSRARKKLIVLLEHEGYTVTGG